jgi:hypothetical protein
MQKFFGAVVLISLGAIFLVFAVANRHLVTVSFDPFNSADPSFKVTGPLFLVFGQRRWRRAARRHEADARQARTQLADLRASAVQRGNYPRVPALPPGGSYRSSERDKQVATL